ncbi:hypothetical protein D3C81_1285530 [compost metagenome]
MVGEYADVAGDAEGGFDDFPGRQVGFFQQRAGGSLGVGATGAHGDQAVLRLYHVAVAGDDQRGVFVGNCQHGFEAAQGAVGAPFFGEFDGGANQMALVFFQLAFETFEKGKGVSRGTGKTGEDFAVVQATDFLGVAFHHGIAERNLAVAAHDDFAVATN